MPKHILLPPVLISPVIAALCLAGCGFAPNSATPKSAMRPQASSLRTVTDPAKMLAIYEAKPSNGQAKRPINIPAVPGVPATAPKTISIVKIQALAASALADADQKQTWTERYTVTSAALQKIDEIKLQQQGLTNVSAKIGLNAVKPYGYIGLWPNAENRFKVQSVVLAFFKDNASEPALSKGSPIFAMSADMIDATTNWDQGFKVGVAVLSTIRDDYKDKEITKAAQGILDKACDAKTREEAITSMVEGLRQLATTVSG